LPEGHLESVEFGSQRQKEEVQKFVAYVKANRDRMNYREYARAGYPVSFRQARVGAVAKSRGQRGTLAAGRIKRTDGVGGDVAAIG